MWRGHGRLYHCQGNDFNALHRGRPSQSQLIKWLQCLMVMEGLTTVRDVISMPCIVGGLSTVS